MGYGNNTCNTQMWEVSTTTDTSNYGSISIGRIILVEVLQHGQDWLHSIAIKFKKLQQTATVLLTREFLLFTLGFLMTDDIWIISEMKRKGYYRHRRRKAHHVQRHHHNFIIFELFIGLLQNSTILAFIFSSLWKKGCFKPSFITITSLANWF